MRSISLIIILVIIIIIAIVGIFYGYNVLNTSNKHISSNLTNTVDNYNRNLTIKPDVSQHIRVKIKIYNDQNIPTPAPFQQQILLCYNVSYENISSDIPYISNATLYKLINHNGSNVFFTDEAGNILYSWFVGRTYKKEIGFSCYNWWIKLPNGIPANSNITIYMYIGNKSSNYYQQYYPYVGISLEEDRSGKYDNGKYVFIVYGYFYNTTDGWVGYNYSGSWTIKATTRGIKMTDDFYQSTYILPPNNGNIPKIPLIVEVAWMAYDRHIPFCNTGGSFAIALFGDTNHQITSFDVGATGSKYLPVPNSSIFVEFNLDKKYIYLKSAVTNTTLNSTYAYYLNAIRYYWFYYPTFYSYLIVNSTHVIAGYEWLYDVENPSVRRLGDIPFKYPSEHPNNHTYYSLGYNPFQYGNGTLQISTKIREDCVDLYVYWVVARAYPPNGVMPRIYLG